MPASPSRSMNTALRSPTGIGAPLCSKVLALLLVLCGAMYSSPVRAQVAGQNVNMVSGTGWTNGDPFLERQNEPSIAVSTRNGAHLFGASNDYRSVDLPGLLGIDERGDAWLGIYKSFDGGQTWRSTLLPGYPLDSSPEGAASPIHGRQAAADPLVRAGSNGLFYLTGIAFDRGSNALSKVFISRFIDLNNKENGDAANENGAQTNLAPRDPVKYIDTHVIDSGSANRFLDKPWVAVDIPRGQATCTLKANEDGKTVTQKIPAGAIYVTYTAFTTIGTVQNSQILFRRSMDCGATWSRPIVLSHANDPAGKPDAEGQGTVIAIDPSVPDFKPAKIYVAWRVFAEPGDSDDASEIRIVESTDGGQTFDQQETAVKFPLLCNTKPSSVGCPFDQGTSSTTFRSNGYPALTVDKAGRIYLAWSQRDSNGDGRIVMAVSNNVDVWPSKNFREIDYGQVYDDYGAPFTNLSNRGSQLMPTLNFNAGKLMLTYYDLRQDHTSGQLTPGPEPTCDPTVTPLCALGNPFSEFRQFEDELVTNPGAVFGPYIDDATLTMRRHTLDILGSEATPDPNPASLVLPGFNHFRVSRYEFGVIPPGASVQQAQFNAPNLPMFVQGTAPFMGDYIDVAGAPTMVPDGSTGWKFNTSPATNPVFHAAWTDNRDVLPPPDGISWNKYTPPFSASIGATSKFDPTQTPPACVPGYSGMRNQNIYTSTISHGLVLTSPQTAKPVLQSNGQPIQRQFVVIMRNDTNLSRSFQLKIPAQPASAQASFLQFSLLNTLTVNIPAFSSASRPVFLTPNAGNKVSFPLFEVDALETDGAQPQLSGSILFNSDPTNPALASPDNAAFGAGTISSQEFYNPAILNPAILNPAILNPAILNPAILNPAILNPAILNPAILNPAILNPNFVVALNPAILNPAILNPAILNNAVANPAILNPAILNTPVSDANYTLTNQGNTSATYQLQLFQSGALPASAVLQIILTKTYLTPGVDPNDGCTYGGQINNEVIASIDNPSFVTNPAQLGNPAILNSAINNPTFSMAPGDTVQVTIRANLTVSDLANFVLPNLSPVVASQAVNTVDVQSGITTPPISLLVSTSSLPFAVTGQSYSSTLAALGGNAPLSADTWTLIGGSLPPGVNLSSAGVISGVATSTGIFPIVVQVTDTGTPQHTATRSLSINVVAPVAIQTPPLPNASLGTPYTQLFAATGGQSPYTWSSTRTLPPGLTISNSGLLSGVPTALGTFSFSVTATDSLGLFATAPYTILVTNVVVQSPSQINFVVQPSNTVGSQPFSPAVQTQVFDVTGAVIPNVQVVMGFSNLACPTATLLGSPTATTNASGIATFTNLSVDHGQTNYTIAATAGNAFSISNPFNIEGFCETGSMAVGRHNHSVITLGNGKVLVAGGAVNPDNSGVLASAELFDPASHTFSIVGSMNVARADFTMTLLPNGKVLVTGGFNDISLTNTAELFDPTTNTFSLTGAMTIRRAEHTATLLPNGKVLIAGGNSNGLVTVASAEIFDPATNTFTASAQAMSTVRQTHHADVLPNGQVLINGGFDGNGNPLASSELYDPLADTFTLTGNMNTARGNHASTLLYTGKLLVAGGLATINGTLARTTSAELYDPASGTWNVTGSMVMARGHYFTTTLSDGTIFIPGTAVLPGGNNADIYDPSTGTFRLSANFTAVQTGAHEGILPDGTVLLASGVDINIAAVPNSEIFYPSATAANITVTTSALANATQNVPYTQLLLERGGVGNLTWTLVSGALPSGVTLTPGGVLLGTPTSSGTFTFTVQAVDSGAPQKSGTSGTLSLTVSSAVTTLVFAPQTLPIALTGTSYTASLVASGGTAPYGFAVTSGSLPTGINLGPNGVFTGSTSAVGTFSFGVTVTDSSATPQSSTQSFTIQVVASISVTTTSLPNAITHLAGQPATPYSAQILTTGGAGGTLTFSVISGALPSSITLNSVTGALSSSSVTDPAGNYNFTIQAVSAGPPSSTATQALTLTLVSQFAGTTPNTLPSGTVSAAYSQNLTSAGGAAPFIYQLAPGVAGNALPPGLAIVSPANSTVGQLSGTPTQSGSFTFTLQATDSSVPQQSYLEALTVTFAPAVIPPAHIAFTVSPLNSVAGQVLQPGAVQVLVTDSTSAPIPNVSVSVGFNGTPPCTAANLGGTVTQTTDATGTATFANLTIDRGQFGYTLAASAGNVSGISTPFNVEGFCSTATTSATRFAGTATPLQNGLVLLAGGVTAGTPTSVVATAELYDPVAHTLTPTGSMSSARAFHTATLLNDGTVLISGGSATTLNGSSFQLGPANSTAEIYNPSTGTFTSLTATMNSVRALHTSTLLLDGTVLLAGGSSGGTSGANLSSAETYDPVAQTFTASASGMTAARNALTATMLTNGQVLLAGGYGSSGTSNQSAEIYDPLAQTFTATSAMAFAHGQHTATLLPNGQVVLTGGDDATFTPTNQIEIFDPVAGTFTASPAVLNPTARTTHSAVLLPDGRVLVDSGFDASGNILNSAEAFNFATANSTPTGSMQFPRWYSTNTLLPDGTVLVSGGSFSSGTLTTLPAEIFYPANTVPITFFTLLPTAQQNQPYTQLLLQQGGIGALTWTLTSASGPLPPGMNLTSNGVLSGTPTTFGAFAFTVQVTDSSVPPKTGTSTFVLLVSPIFQFFGPQLPTALSGVAYSNSLPIIGGTSPYSSTLTVGVLPAGLNLANNTISGTTTALGNYSLTFQATDSSVPPQTTTGTLTLGVTTPLTITTSTLPNGALNSSYSATIASSGGLGSILFGPTSNTLPPGLTMSTQGVISGTPTQTGTFSFGVLAVDQSLPPQTFTQPESITVTTAVAPISLSPNPLNLLANNTGVMTVTLSSPAGTNGQVVTLASSSPTVASVPASVTVPSGTSSISFQVTAGGSAGTTTITASATGATSGNASVVVTTRPMSLTPDSPLLAVNRSFNATVTLAQAVPTGSTVTVTLSSNTAGVVTISPASQTILAGQTTAVFQLTAGSTSGSTVLTATAPGYTTATAPLTVTSNLISFGTIPVLAPGQTASLPVNLSFAAPPGGLTINFTSTNPAVATITPSVFVPAGLLVPAANPQVTGVSIGSTQFTASAIGFAPDAGAVSVTVTAGVTPNPTTVNATRTVVETVTISAAAPSGGITFGLSSDTPSVATVPATATVLQGQLTVPFVVTGVAQGTANITVTSPGITPVTVPVTVNAAPAISFSIPVVGNNTITSATPGLTVAPATNQLMTLTSNDPAHFLLTTDPTKIGTATITLQMTAGTTSVPTFYIEGQGYSGTTAITSTVTASSPGYTSVSPVSTLYPTGLSYLFTSTLTTTTFSSPTVLTAYLAVLNPGTLTLYTYGLNLGPQAPGAVPVAVTSSNTSFGTITGGPATIGVGIYYTQALSFQPAAAGTTNLNLATPSGYSTPANSPVQIVATVSAPLINVSSLVVGNNTVIGGAITLGAPPPTGETITLTSGDPTHFLLSTSATTVGTASITLQLTAGSSSVPNFYIEGMNYSGTTAITASLTASANGFTTGSGTMSLYPSGLTYLFTSTLSTTTFSPPTVITTYLAVLSPGTLNLYTYGYNLGPQAPAAVPVAVTSSNTSVGTVTGGPASIGVGTYYTQAFSFQPVAAGSTNLNLATPTGYSTPSSSPVQIVTTVTAPAINVSTSVVGNNLLFNGGITLGAAPPTAETMTVTSSDPTHFLLTTDPTKVGTASITLQLTAGSAGVPSFYIEGQNYSGTTAITASLTATAAGYSSGNAAMSLYPSGLTYLFTNTLSTTTFTPPTTLTAYLGILSPGTLTLYTYGYVLGPQAPGAVPVSITSSSTSVGTLTGSPSSIGVGAYYTQAISFHPATAGTTNLNLATPAGYSTPSNSPVQIVTTVSAPAITLNNVIVGNNLIAGGSASLGAPPPSNEMMTISTSDPTHFLLTTDPTKVGTASINVQLTGGSSSIPQFYVEGMNFSGPIAISATLTASAAGYSDGNATVSLYPSGLTYLFTSSLNTTATSSPTVLTVYAVVLQPGTLNLYTYGYNVGPQAPTAIPVSVTSSNTSVGTITGSPASIGVGTYYTQAISFVPVASGTTNLNLTTPTGYTTSSNSPVQILATVQ